MGRWMGKWVGGWVRWVNNYKRFISLNRNDRSVSVTLRCASFRESKISSNDRTQNNMLFSEKANMHEIIALELNIEFYIDLLGHQQR
ncbi:Myosin-IIIa [Dirofilaria immitis]